MCGISEKNEHNRTRVPLINIGDSDMPKTRFPNIRFNRPSPEKRLTFYNDGRTFSAMYQAQAWLRERGYSYGSTCLSPYVAIQKGKYTLPQKMHNFDKEDLALIDGVIYSTDYREGEVEIWLKEVAI